MATIELLNESSARQHRFNLLYGGNASGSFATLPEDDFLRTITDSPIVLSSSIIRPNGASLGYFASSASELYVETGVLNEVSAYVRDPMSAFSHVTISDIGDLHYALSSTTLDYAQLVKLNISDVDIRTVLCAAQTGALLVTGDLDEVFVGIKLGIPFILRTITKKTPAEIYANFGRRNKEGSIRY